MGLDLVELDLEDIMERVGKFFEREYDDELGRGKLREIAEGVDGKYLELLVDEEGRLKEVDENPEDYVSLFCDLENDLKEYTSQKRNDELPLLSQHLLYHLVWNLEDEKLKGLLTEVVIKQDKNHECGITRRKEQAEKIAGKEYFLGVSNTKTKLKTKLAYFLGSLNHTLSIFGLPGYKTNYYSEPEKIGHRCWEIAEIYSSDELEEDHLLKLEGIPEKETKDYQYPQTDFDIAYEIIPQLRSFCVREATKNPEEKEKKKIAGTLFVLAKNFYWCMAIASVASGSNTPATKQRTAYRNISGCYEKLTKLGFDVQEEKKKDKRRIAGHQSRLKEGVEEQFNQLKNYLNKND